MNRYGQIARAYWETYLPSRMATVGDPETFFRKLGEEVQEQIEAGTAQATIPETSSSEELTAAYQGAAKAAEEAAMADLVFLPPEPGTEDRRMPGTLLPGWEDDPTAR